MTFFLILFLGLSIGSFLANFTYRAPRGEDIKKGLSKCDHCGKKLVWYDNIPVISYLLLSGKSRCCNKKISIRYPLIELSVALLFLLVHIMISNCITPSQESFFDVCLLKSTLGIFVYPFLFTAMGILVMIFVIDLENEIIPDELVFWLLGIFLFAGLLTGVNLYLAMLSGFGAAAFLLTLNLITKGKGMGLGDVKLALALGFILSWPYTLIWMSLSFMIGAAIGVFLIGIGKAKLGRHIPFGPFLVFSFFVVYLCGEKLFEFVPIFNFFVQ